MTSVRLIAQIEFHYKRCNSTGALYSFKRDKHNTLKTSK